MNVFLFLAQVGLWLLAGFIVISFVCWLLVYGINDIRGDEQFGNWFLRTVTRYNYRENRYRRLRNAVWGVIFHFAAKSPYLYIYRRIQFPDSFRFGALEHARSRRLCLKPWGWRHDWVTEETPSDDPTEESFKGRICRRCHRRQVLLDPKWYRKQRWSTGGWVSDNWFDA
ncbi:MAG: hypothetical protein V4671_12795 [Armatimonadota bacterium]